MLTNVSAFIFKDNQVLIAQRADNEDLLLGYWELVGGGVETNETPKQACLRETKEEAGIDIAIGRQYGNFPFTHPELGQIDSLAFVCVPKSNSAITLSFEHQNYRWITAAELGDINPMTDRMRSMILQGFNEV